ncbi:MAG: hydroxymethylglutaryl-CoA reductase, degradative [Minisyncoccales bacterium]
MKNNYFHHFHKLSLGKKLEILKDFCSLSKEEIFFLRQYQKLPDFIDFENNIGPFKIATNFLINQKEYFVAMETEEPSVVAAASAAAKFFRKAGGFTGKRIENKIIGQIQMEGGSDFKKINEILKKKKAEILEMANKTNALLFQLGGGAKDFFLKKIKNYFVFYLVVDPKDAQGANIVNTMLEKINPFISRITKKRIISSIVSNFSPKRIIRAQGKISLFDLKKKFPRFQEKEIAKRFLDLFYLAKNDIYRATTHNKGIMNGIDAVLLATGNDFRAQEAAAHSFAVKKGKYQPLTDWKVKGDFLMGMIKIPLWSATVGGATQTKKAILAKKIMRIESSEELAIVCATVGLANNFSALLRITTEGIQKGHMKLHREFLNRL